jgi:SMODS-associating 2TM, beta-strand rich effector domain
MLKSNWIRGVILLAAGIAALIVWLHGGKVQGAWIRALVTAASVVTLLAVVYDQWVWRWPLVRELTSRPVVQGTWKATLRSSHHAALAAPIESYLVVRQTYSRVSVRMLFERSASRSMSGDVVFEDGVCVLYYLYAKQTRALDLDGNPSSRGGAALTIARQPRMHLQGDYWTDVGTAGEIETVGYCRKLYDSFLSAQDGTYS